MLGEQCLAPGRGVFPSVFKRFNDMPGRGEIYALLRGVMHSFSITATDLYSPRRRNLWKEGIDVLLISKKPI